MIIRPNPSNPPSSKARKRFAAAKCEQVQKRQGTPQKKPQKSPRKSKASRSLPVTAPSMPAELKQVNLNAAGIDVGATVHFVCVPEGRDPQPVQSGSIGSPCSSYWNGGGSRFSWSSPAG